ncbi:hypothetical protein G9A89_018719 [Geosiphon pyriformis]|nr:hypothetical protein G9A89_018719 [Geosiphon pyriformis]
MTSKTGDSLLIDGQDLPTTETFVASATHPQEEIWSSILNSAASSKIVPTKNVLILGDRESGKSNLISQLKGEGDELFEVAVPNGVAAKSIGVGPEDPSSKQRQKNDLALSYTYLEIKDKDDETEDTIARLGLYQLAGSQKAYNSLLRFALNSTTLADSLVVIVLDWARPWTFIETLQRWIKLVQEGIHAIRAEGAVTGSKSDWTEGQKVVEEVKESLLRFIQNYTDPDSATPVSNTDIDIPLRDGTLTENLGVPLIVVCAKSDSILNHQRELDYKEDQFDFIQQSLRTICLKYGAALFYTTPRQSMTFTNLRQYILHRLLGEKSFSSDTKSNYGFNVKAQVLERDTVMVPAGWDTWGKIKTIREDFECERMLQGWDYDMEVNPDVATTDRINGESISAKKDYDEVVYHQDSDKPSVQSMIVAEDEQDFFKRHFDTLQKASNERNISPSVVGPMAAAIYTYNNIGGPEYDVEDRLAKYKKESIKTTNQLPPLNIVNTNGTNPSSPTATATNQNEVLANFFQALLTKKQASTNQPPGPPGSVTTNVVTRKMVKEEIEKLNMVPSSQTASAVGK